MARATHVRSGGSGGSRRCRSSFGKTMSSCKDSIRLSIVPSLSFRKSMLCCKVPIRLSIVPSQKQKLEKRCNAEIENTTGTRASTRYREGHVVYNRSPLKFPRRPRP
ncbi:unnamed protein product [Prorocentrum cordatum]|nr:unnamed protein product [Polarella glacialis]